MMIGETHHHVPPWQESSTNPTVQITPSSPPSQLSSQSYGPNQLPNSPTYYDAVLASLRRYLNATKDYSYDDDDDDDDDDFVAQDYDDDFFMYDFKVRKCVRARAHDWTECPFAHPGEKARRRDPRKYNYSGTSCSEFRKGGCKKGDACEFAHGVFECWLHPARFRTQACKDGPDCKRWVCFFAHTPDQLRTVQGLGSPRGAGAGAGARVGAASSPTIGELAAKLQTLQFNKIKSMPTTWGATTHHASQHMGGSPTTTCNMGGSIVYGSPRSVVGSSSINRAGFYSLPTTPTQSRIGYWDNIDSGYDLGDPMMERVESGRELRVQMFEKLSKENPLDGSDTPLLFSTPRSNMDLGWVSDLIE